MAELNYEWRELGPLVNLGDVKLLENGHYSVYGVKKAAAPNKWFEVHCPGHGFMLFEYDGNRWFGCRLRVGPEWQVTSGTFEGYLATLDLRDIEVSEVRKSLADNPYGTTPFFLFGLLLIAGGLFSMFIGEGGAMVVVFGCLGVALGMGLARMVTFKCLRLKTENGVFDVSAEKFEKMLKHRLQELERERTVEISRAPELQPVVAVRQWRMTSIVSPR
jgi:hypothetical protein